MLTEEERSEEEKEGKKGDKRGRIRKEKGKMNERK